MAESFDSLVGTDSRPNPEKDGLALDAISAAHSLVQEYIGDVLPGDPNVLKAADDLLSEIPALLEEVTRLRSEVAALRESRDKSGKRICALLHCERRREFEQGNHDDACPLATGYVASLR